MRRIIFLLGFLPLTAWAGDWPQLGHDGSRNMVSDEKPLPDTWTPGEPEAETGKIDLAKTKNVKWVSRLGNQAYGNPTVGGGRILVGTNNEVPRDPNITGDRGVLMCFDEANGNFLWQLAVPKLEAGNKCDYESVGICSSPTIDGDRVYLVSNRCEVLSVDLNTGKVIWRYDMRDELGVFPFNMTSSSVLVVGDRLYVTTSNAVDWTLKHTPAPDAPALICLDKKTGKLLARETSGISARTFHSNWSSPVLGVINNKPAIFFGGGDGFCYAFDIDLKEIWRCDANPPERRKAAYGTNEGPSEILATPVFHDGKIYCAIGQEPTAGDGPGALTCINGTGKIVWACTKIGRSISTPAINNGLIFTADLAGMIYCIDEANGNILWKQDAEANMWASPLLADGKVYIANQSGICFVLAATREMKLIGKIDFASGVFSSAIAANSTLFLSTEKNLYAIAPAK